MEVKNTLSLVLILLLSLPQCQGKFDVGFVTPAPVPTSYYQEMIDQLSGGSGSPDE